MTVIKDGSGSGYLVKVDNENFLHTSSRVYKLSAHESISSGLAFSIVGTTTITASVEKTVVVLINNSNSGIDIGLEMHTMAIQGDSGHPAIVNVYLGNKTYLSGGTILTPVGLNTGISQTLNVTAIGNNPVLGGLDSLIAVKMFETTTTFDFIIDAKRVLSPGGSFRVTITGDAGAVGTKVMFSTVEYFKINLQALE